MNKELQYDIIFKMLKCGGNGIVEVFKWSAYLNCKSVRLVLLCDKNVSLKNHMIVTFEMRAPRHHSEYEDKRSNVEKP